MIRDMKASAAMTKPCIYLIGSLRNPDVIKIGAMIRAAGAEAFDDWHGAGPEADDHWQKYENARGRNFKEALAGHAAQNVFHFDKTNLDRADAVILIMPAGKSGHLEFGYAMGQGKPGVILIPGEPERFDVMYNFASAGIAYTPDDALALIRPHLSKF